MKNKKMSEDVFLSERVAERRPVYCWLASGIKLQGTILAFDPEAIFMKPHTANDDADVMMIFKVQVASIAPVPGRSAVRIPDATTNARRGQKDSHG